jgi:hypothetical protein
LGEWDFSSESEPNPYMEQKAVKKVIQSCHFLSCLVDAFCVSLSVCLYFLMLISIFVCLSVWRSYLVYRRTVLIQCLRSSTCPLLSVCVPSNPATYTVKKVIYFPVPSVPGYLPGRIPGCPPTWLHICSIPGYIPGCLPGYLPGQTQLATCLHG